MGVILPPGLEISFPHFLKLLPSSRIQNQEIPSWFKARRRILLGLGGFRAQTSPLKLVKICVFCFYLCPFYMAIRLFFIFRWGEKTDSVKRLYTAKRDISLSAVAVLKPPSVLRRSGQGINWINKIKRLERVSF